MFDTMTMTKIIGGFCGAFLIFLLGKWAAEELYSMDAGHGGEEHTAGYVIEIADAGGDDAASDEVDFATVLASADAAKGEKVFGKCKACHKLEDGANGTGPYLYGVVGRPIGGVDGFGYSGTIAGMGGVWGPDELNGFLENPKKFAPGTKMSFAGLKKVEDRADLIAYLSGIGG